jgi:hypothetical protein
MNTKFFALAALALSLAACTNDNAVMDNSPVAARINAEISNTVTTRASGTTWEDKDKIGVSTIAGTGTYYNNICYERNGSSFTATGENIYFQTPESVTFRAYYPFTGTPGESAGVLAGVSTGSENQTAENRPLIDFLYATGADADTHHPTINFTDNTEDYGEDCSFHHCMSQITLTFEAGSGVSFTAIKPVSYTLSGLTLTGSFDTETGIAKADEDAQTANLTMGLDGVLTSSVILFPQTRASIGLTVVYNDNEYNATLNVPDGALKSGDNYTWTVTVRNTGLSIGSAEISDWNPVSGGIVDADL